MVVGSYQIANQLNWFDIMKQMVQLIINNLFDTEL